MYKNLALDAYEAAAVFIHKKQLLDLENIVRTEEGGMDMCKAIDEMILEGELRGEQRGEQIGEARGLDLMGRLAKRMWEEGKVKEFIEFACEQDRRDDLLKKYEFI
ncbi:hypothetical protein [Robinsoniella peoriensis]